MPGLLLSLLRSLSFGGLLGGGLAGLLALMLNMFGISIPFEASVLTGTLLGGGLHRVVGRVWDYFAGTIASPRVLESELHRLLQLHDQGLLSDAKFIELTDKVIERRMLGSTDA